MKTLSGPFVKAVGTILIILYLLLPGSGCSKTTNSADSTAVVDLDSGRFVALLNNSTWHPVYHGGIYYPKWHQLFISATDKYNAATGIKYSLYVGINLDSINVSKKYLLEPNGENSARFIYDDYYYSDDNMADAGGSFTLTKFDTATKTMSGMLQFTAFDRFSAKKITLSSTIIEDIPIRIDTSAYNGNNASCTVSGVTTTNWQSKNIYASIDCMSATQKTLYIGICSVMRQYPSLRTVLIKIPLINGKGTYQIMPELPPYSYCGDNHITSDYCVLNYDKRYFAASGQLNILNIDTANRKLSATFNIKYIDSSSSRETINITNGKVNLNTWANMTGH